MEGYNNYLNNNNEFKNIVQNEIEGAKISIIGVGGGGGNAINLMKESNIEGVKYIAVNTDIQHLSKSLAEHKIPLAKLGAGANPEVGRQTAEEMRGDIKKHLIGQDMIFITAGMGGGTGTGASPVIAEIAKELDILTVAVVTTPFKYEGPRRLKNAEYGIKELKKNVDSLIVISNDRLRSLNSDEVKIKNAFNLPNEVLNRAVKGIAEIVTKEGMINVDFADVKTVMKNSGESVIGLGETKEGEDVLMAVETAIKNPLLEKGVKGAKNILLNITMSPEATFDDFDNIMTRVRELAESDDVDIMLGVILDENIKTTRITIVATGFEDEPKSVAQTVSESIDNSRILNGDDNTRESFVDNIVLPKLD